MRLYSSTFILYRKSRVFFFACKSLGHLLTIVKAKRLTLYCKYMRTFLFNPFTASDISDSFGHKLIYIVLCLFICGIRNIHFNSSVYSTVFVDDRVKVHTVYRKILRRVHINDTHCAVLGIFISVYMKTYIVG